MNEDSSGGRRFEVSDDPQDRRLAAPARTDERDEFTFADMQADIRECGQRAVAEGEGLGEMLDSDRAAIQWPGRRGYDPFAANSKMEVFMTSAAVIGLSIWFRLLRMSMPACQVA